ncbi:MAG TPA: VWA domain-containing protein [Terracidiphilus sp.]|nr:VWA domain-containing protein [Terracidiphilus sp.]
MWPLRTSSAVTGLALGAASLFAQQPVSSGNAQLPVYQANARDVVVDVVVTDSHGEPVTGLHKQDFTLTEDGKPQALDYFEEHTSMALPAGATPALPAMPPGVYTNVPPAPENDAVNVLLLDTLNNDPRYQPYMRQQIIRFLLGMKPGTRIAIFALGSKLRFVQGFTTDATVLRAALERFVPGHEPMSETMSDTADSKEALAILTAMASAVQSPGSAQSSIQASTATEGPGAAQSPSSTQGGSAAIEAIASALADESTMLQANRVAMTLEALQYLARYLGDVPGRKNLIWFSSSFPVNIFPSPEQQQALSDARVFTDQIRKTADMLTAARVAVYPIESEGMMEDHVAEADSSLEETGRGSGLMGNLMASASSRTDTIYTMEQLAAETGGKAFYNSNDLSGEFNHAITNGSQYYTLVYSPANKKMNGHYRNVEVKIPGEKYHLSYRRGYNADDTQAALKTASNPLQPLLHYGLPSATQILFGARVKPTDPQPAPDAKLAGQNAKLAKPVRRYSVDMLIRWSDLKLDEARDDRHTGQIEVELLAYDRDGHAVNWTGGTQSMSLDPKLYAAIQHSGVPAHLEIDLPAREDVYLEAGVYDWGTGKAGTLEIPVPARTDTAQAAPPAH